MRKFHLSALTGTLAVVCVAVLLLGAKASAGESEGNVWQRPSAAVLAETGPKFETPLSPEALVQQSVLLFFGVVFVAVSGLRGKEVISPTATVRLLGASIVLATSIFLAYSQLDPGRLMPVVAMLGMSLGLFFAKTEGEERAKPERVQEPPAARTKPQSNGPPNGPLPAALPTGQGGRSEEKSDALSSSPL